MRKKVLLELQKKIQENLEAFYAAAYAVTGEREGAEKLAEDAVFLGAKRYNDLMNKARFYDIVMQKIGAGEKNGFEPCDCDLLCARIMARVRAWNIKSAIAKVSGTTAIICAVVIGAVSLILPKVYEAKSNQVLLMNDTIALEGDYDISELVNYHRASDKIELSEGLLNRIGRSVETRNLVSMMTAPDGTPYLLVNDFGKMNTYVTTFTLYRGYEDGWKAVGTGDIGAGYENDGGHMWVSSELYVFADNDSDAYVVLREIKDIVIYRYDKKEETFEKTATIPYINITDFIATMVVTFDPNVGESGTAYIAYRKDENVTVLRYDTATDTHTVITSDLRLSSSNTSFYIAAHHDIVYILDVLSASVKSMTLYALYPDGYADSVILQDERTFPVFMGFDEKGKLHIVGSYGEVQYIFSEDLSFVRGGLSMSYHYYEDSDYYSSIIGGFVGKDGRIYCVEQYSGGAAGESNFIAICMLDSEDPSKSTFINGFDLIDNIGNVNYMNGKDCWFFTSEYSQDEYYMVYFHINELD